ncbi:MAG: GNAT family N-acetyltransferase [Bifidobacterium sp.]|jgi:ribosomal protein S18 acetylase RimI-like enzyme|nr:GNAT family N-acetyltransferase [Bifidobacterium sp.]
MENITTMPATIERWHDVQAALTGGGDGRSCQCAWPMMTGAQWRTSSVDERRSRLREELSSGAVPGLVAYVGGVAAGWVRVCPRPLQRHLETSRIVKSGSPEPFGDADVWAITCFSVRNEFRRHGVGAALLRAGVDYARSCGARMLEAYPLDNTASKVSSTSLFVGALTTFLDAGFEVVARPTPTRAVVTLNLR